MKNILPVKIIIWFLAIVSILNFKPQPALSGQTPGSSAEKSALTLFECYNLALKQSEIIAVDSEVIKEAEARFLQAFGTLLPQVSFSRSETWQNSEISSSRKSFTQKFVFKQALFSGFKEFAGMSGSKFEKKQRENELLRAKQLLFTDVSDAFYLLLEEREDLKTLNSIRVAFLDRNKELKKRVDLGKSRDSEVVSTEVQLYNSEDQIELVKSQESVARQLLEFLIGRDVEEIREEESKFELKPESEYLALAAERPDVKAANLAWKVSQKQVSIAKSGFLPQVNFEGDYFTHRSALPDNNRWAALLTVDVPIFEGTVTIGQVKEAVAKARENEFLFTRSGRSAVQDIHDSYVNAQADFSRVAILEKALKSAELNYNLQIKDYQSNVVNNLDVLTAIQDLENARRNYNHILFESKRFYWRLQVAAGEINLNIIK